MSTPVTTDIYETKEIRPGEIKNRVKKSRSRRKIKSFDEAVDPHLAKTHRRRSRNSGLRRFRHKMKKPDFNRRFWIITLGGLGLILTVLIVWDIFFRYPAESGEQAEFRTEQPVRQGGGMRGL